MGEKDVLKIIHTMNLFSAKSIIKWNKSFQHSIGVSPLLVLADLKQNGAQKQAELARKMGFTPGAMTNISSRLIKHGFAERKYTEEDRRIIYLDITAEGIGILRKAKEKGEESYSTLFTPLNEDEVGQLISLIEKIEDHEEA